MPLLCPSSPYLKLGQKTSFRDLIECRQKINHIQVAGNIEAKTKLNNEPATQATTNLLVAATNHSTAISSSETPKYLTPTTSKCSTEPPTRTLQKIPQCDHCIKALSKTQVLHDEKKLLQLLYKKNEQTGEYTFLVKALHEVRPKEWQEIKGIIESQRNNTTRALLNSLLQYWWHPDKVSECPNSIKRIQKLPSNIYDNLYLSLTIYQHYILEKQLTTSIEEKSITPDTQVNIAYHIQKCAQVASKLLEEALQAKALNAKQQNQATPWLTPTLPPNTITFNRQLNAIECIATLTKAFTKALPHKKIAPPITGVVLSNQVNKAIKQETQIIDKLATKDDQLVLPCIIPTDISCESEFFLSGIPCKTHLHLVTIQREDLKTLNYVFNHYKYTEDELTFTEAILNFFSPWKEAVKEMDEEIREGSIKCDSEEVSEGHQFILQQLRSIFGIKTFLVLWLQCKNVNLQNNNSQYLHIQSLEILSNAILKDRNVNTIINLEGKTYPARMITRSSKRHRCVVNLAATLVEGLPEKHKPFQVKHLSITKKLQQNSEKTTTPENKCTLQIKPYASSMKPSIIRIDPSSKSIEILEVKLHPYSIESGHARKRSTTSLPPAIKKTRLEEAASSSQLLKTPIKPISYPLLP